MTDLFETNHNVDESLHETTGNGKLSNLQISVTILQNIQFLFRQSSCFCKSKNLANLDQFKKLSTKVDFRITIWIKKQDKYLHKDIQHEVIRQLAILLLRDKAKNINERVFFFIMADKSHRL